VGNKISSYKDKNGNKGFHFHCEGCKCSHGVYTEGIDVPVWKFNGNKEKPTFTPSILVRYDHLSEEGRKISFEFKEKNGRFPTIDELPYDINEVCHSFITDGKIRYLNDCTHHLKGQTVELKDF
jgi:hypothetical protein